MVCNECDTCVPRGLSSTMDVTSSMFQACLPPPPWWHVFQCCLYCPTSFAIDTLLWYEWKFPDTAIYRHKPGERRGWKCSEKRGCGEKTQWKTRWQTQWKILPQKNSCLGFIRTLSREVWQCLRLSLTAAKPVVERIAAGTLTRTEQALTMTCRMSHAADLLQVCMGNIHKG